MDERIKKYEAKMQKSLDNLASEYATIRAGRANPHILDRIRVDYYGTPSPIQQVANVSVPEARVIMIKPYDKALMKAIEKAILTSDIGINPSNDGTSIRLVFPELTEDRRKQLCKDVKKKAEEYKVAIRNIRRDGNDSFKKLGKSEEISEDVVKELQDDLQKITDQFIKKVDGTAADKEKEIMTV
ncbi:MAG: ribosome recycling factor [Lachnospiraceae bacterium]|nr:ribosome recycling factor [Lachnospiraceae bacterium]